jgi:predicted ATP-dependent serine protease
VLFGRGDQLDHLAGMVDGVIEGRGRAVVVRGAPGVGKSALLAAARTHAATAGVQILACAGVRSETHLPFAAYCSCCGRSSGRPTGWAPCRARPCWAASASAR